MTLIEYEHGSLKVDKENVLFVTTNTWKKMPWWHHHGLLMWKWRQHTNP